MKCGAEDEGHHGTADFMLGVLTFALPLFQEDRTGHFKSANDLSDPLTSRREVYHNPDLADASVPSTHLTLFEAGHTVTPHLATVTCITSLRHSHITCYSSF